MREGGSRGERLEGGGGGEGAIGRQSEGLGGVVWVYKIGFK